MLRDEVVIGLVQSGARLLCCRAIAVQIARKHIAKRVTHRNQASDSLHVGLALSTRAFAVLRNLPANAIAVLHQRAIVR